MQRPKLPRNTSWNLWLIHKTRLNLQTQQGHEGLFSQEGRICFHGLFLSILPRQNGGKQNDQTVTCHQMCHRRRLYGALRHTAPGSPRNPQRRNPALAHAPACAFVRTGLRLALRPDLRPHRPPALQHDQQHAPGRPHPVRNACGAGLLWPYLRSGDAADPHGKNNGRSLHQSHRSHAGRIAGGLAKAFFFSAGSYSFSVWATAYFVSTLPGILLQLLLLPVLYFALQRAHLLPVRYPQKPAKS